MGLRPAKSHEKLCGRRLADEILWGRLVTCGRLAIGPCRLRGGPAAVTNRRAGRQPAPYWFFDPVKLDGVKKPGTGGVDVGQALPPANCGLDQGLAGGPRGYPACPTITQLFVAQGGDGVDAGGALGRDIAREQGHGYEHGGGRQDAERIVGDDAVEFGAHESGHRERHGRAIATPATVSNATSRRTS